MYQVVIREISSHASIPLYQNGTMAKDACGVRNIYWPRERAHDKTRERVVCVMRCADTLIRFVDNVKK